MAMQTILNKPLRIIDFKNLRGRRKILLDVFYTDFIDNPIKVIKENIDTVIEQHCQNVSEFRYLEDFKKGFQDIYKKVKANGNNINNMEVTNYSWEIVKFKLGYYVGKPITYVNNNDDTNDEMVFFNRYLESCDKSSKDIQKYNNLLTTGLAYTFTRPNPKKYDSNSEAPYTYDS